MSLPLLKAVHILFYLFALNDIMICCNEPKMDKIMVMWLWLERYHSYPTHTIHAKMADSINCRCWRDITNYPLLSFPFPFMFCGSVLSWLLTRNLEMIRSVCLGEYEGLPPTLITTRHSIQHLSHSETLVWATCLQISDIITFYQWFSFTHYNFQLSFICLSYLYSEKTQVNLPIWQEELKQMTGKWCGRTHWGL